MKKLLVSAAAATGGLLVWRRVQRDRAEQQLWAEVTDSIASGSGSREPGR